MPGDSLAGASGWYGPGIGTGAMPGGPTPGNPRPMPPRCPGAPRPGSRPGEEPAVDDEGGAGDVAAGLAGQEEGGADQLVGVGPSAEDRRRGDGGLLLVGEDGGRQVGQERAGREAIDRDPVAAELDGAGAGQPHQG